MFKTSTQFMAALHNDKNFINEKFLFNMCPESQKELYNGRFWIVDLFDLEMPVRKVGVMIWDDQKEKLYGPYIHPENKTLDGYKFHGQAISSTELYLYFAEHNDYRVCEFTKEEPVFEDC